MAADYEGARACSRQAISELVNLRFIEVTASAFSLHVEACLASTWVSTSSAVPKLDLRRSARAAFLARRVGFLFPNALPHAYRVSGRLRLAQKRTRQALRYFDKGIASAEEIGANYEHAHCLIDKSMLDYPEAKADRQRGLQMLEGLGCVLPVAEVEYLGIDRETHYARASAERENAIH